MSATAVLLKFVGLDPDRKKVQEEFDEKLGQLDEANARLDDIMAELKKVNKTATAKREALGKTLVPGSFPAEEAPTDPLPKL